MKFPFLLTSVVAVAIAAAPAHADYAADKKLLDQLGPFVPTLEEKDVATVKTLIEAPNFRPTLEYYKGYSVFKETLHLYNVRFARLVMASPSWKKVQWDAQNIAKPLLLAASDAELLPILQDLAKQPQFDLNTPKAENGEFPILRVAKRDNMPALTWLARQPGVDVNKRDNLDRNALFDASHRAALFLISLPQFDANSRSMSGETALHDAVSAEEIDTVRALLATPKIDPNIRDKSKHPRTALDMALAANKADIAASLIGNRKVRSTPAQRALLKRMRGGGPNTAEPINSSPDLLPLPGTMTGSNDYEPSAPLTANQAAWQEIIE